MLRRACLALIIAASAAVPVINSPAPALADDTGLASMHPWRKVGGKTCFVDHYHDGAGVGLSRGKAEADAINNWRGFTALEYGSDWANYGIAANRTMKCDRITSEHKCNVSALPCRGR